MIEIIHDNHGALALVNRGWAICIEEHNYCLGNEPPNYPVPATASTAALSIYHQDRWPNTIWPYVMVKNDLKYFT